MIATGGHMSKSLLAGLVFAAFIAVEPTVAADLLYGPAYKPAAPLATGYNWTGFYAGANLGYGWSNEATALSIFDGPGGACHFCGPPSDVPIAQGVGSPSLNPNGFAGGVQLGYNWQLSHWVYGFEVDFEGLDQHQTINSRFGLPNLTATPGSCGPPNNCLGNFSTSASNNWLFTARPRLGYAWDRTLVYATGGLAVTKTSFSQSYSDNVTFGIGTGGTEVGSASKTMAGWTVGAGVEQAIGDRWSVKAEYLYTQFGGLTAFGGLTDGIPGDFANFTNNVGNLSSHLVRAGLNYRFGGP
jgi:outer membrane immunogenic protein